MSLVLVVALSGCLKPDPTLLQGQIRAGTDINPTAEGQASPVVVRVYALRSAGAFQSADFFALYDRDQATLKEDLLSRDELQLLPGSSQALNKELPAEAGFIGVLAAFRNLDRANWRAVYPLQPHQPNRLTVSVSQRNLSIGP
jgi:type VI secretion system protein VasD